LFGTTVLSLMLNQQGPKHVGLEVLKGYCNSNEVYTYVETFCKKESHARNGTLKN
jgi:hypothetical protein